MKGTPILTNFTSGEITPRLRGRVDVAKYYNGCENITNMIVTPQGGAFKRPGTLFIQEQKAKTRLISFEYSVAAAYVLGLVAEVGATAAHICVYKSKAVVSLTHAPVIYFTEAELSDVQYTQSADILYLFHQKHGPAQVMRFADAHWSIMPMLLRDGPYLDINTTDTTVCPDTPAGVAQSIKGMAYGATKYVAVGIPGAAANLHYSSDTLVWTNVDLSSAYTLYSVYFDNSLFVTVGEHGVIFTSTNGTAWTSRTSGVATDLYDVCYDSGLTLWVAVGAAGVILTSPDGVTWTSRTSGVSTALYGVCKKGTNGAAAITVGAAGIILTSADCITWTARTSGTTNNLRSVALYDDTVYKYYAVGDAGTILSSANATAWTSVSCAVTSKINRVISNDDYQVAVGDAGIIIKISNVTGIYTYQRIDTVIDLYAAMIVDPTFGFNYGGWGPFWGVYSGGTDGFITQDDYFSVAETSFRIRSIVTQAITASDEIFDYTRDSTLNPRHIRVKGTTNWGWGTIIGFYSTTGIVIDVREPITTASPGSTATTEWRLGAFYRNNYPACGQFYEQRLCMANTPAKSQTIWLSASGDFTNFQPAELDGTVTDSMGMSLTVASNTVEPVQWLRGANALLMGTPNGIWKLSGSSSDAALTPTNATCKKQGTRGTASVPPQFVGPGSLYIQRLGRKIRELVYSYADDSFLTPDMTLLSEHITEDSIIDMAYQSEPFGILWGVRNDGYLLSMTYERDQQVVAWSKHNFKSGSGVIEFIACIPGIYQDDVYLSMKITINGTAVWHIMALDDFDFDSVIADAFFVDDGITFTGAGTSITGLSHLEGETVAILGDGLVQATKTVASGAVTAETAIVAKAQAGFPFTSVLQTVNLEAGARSGTSQGKIKRIIQAVVRFLETGDASMGYDSTKTDAIPFTAGALASGDKIMSFPKGWNRDAYVYIKSSNPLPCNILCIIPEVETSER